MTAPGPTPTDPTLSPEPLGRPTSSPRCGSTSVQGSHDTPTAARGQWRKRVRQWGLSGIFLGVTAIAFLEITGTSLPAWQQVRRIFEPEWEQWTPGPLVMKGGDPYIRALMRTISASESNDPRPYSLIYGGSRFSDFSRHPDRCITITVGPNTGNCSTAAGRYQFITTTWETQAERYHPNPDGFWIWRNYGFSPEEQDVVVYRWLSDASEWGVDLSQLLRQGEVREVLRLLSPTWTSLGYGIETNSMSSYLPEIYGEMLEEELGGDRSQMRSALPHSTAPHSTAPHSIMESPSNPQADSQADSQSSTSQSSMSQSSTSQSSPLIAPFQHQVDQATGQVAKTVKRVNQRRQEFLQRLDRLVEGQPLESPNPEASSAQSPAQSPAQPSSASEPPRTTGEADE